jgi:hypothetical protein
MPLSASASDWTRFQKLKSAIDYRSVIQTETDIRSVTTPEACNPCLSNRQTTRTDRDRITGASRIRREASKWTDFVASQQGDFISISEISGFGRQLNRTQICADNTKCLITVPFQTGRGICRPLLKPFGI